jgi:hypothetical protein
LNYFTHIRDKSHDWYRDDQELKEEGYSTHLVAKEACRLIAGQQMELSQHMSAESILNDKTVPLLLHSLAVPHPKETKNLRIIINGCVIRTQVSAVDD